MSAAAGAYVAVEKGRSVAEGITFGLIMGPIGVLIAAVLPTGRLAPPPVPRRRIAEPDERIDASAWDARPGPLEAALRIRP